MTFPKNIYKQSATYWAVSSRDGYGKPTYSAPVLLSVRWQESSERNIKFNEVLETSKAEIMLKQAVQLGGYLALGDFTATVDPTNVNSAYIIKLYEETPGVAGNYITRKAYL